MNNQKTSMPILLLLFLFSSHAFALDPLDILITAVKPKSSSVSVAVWDLTSNKPIYSYNAHQLMLPASTQKLFIASSALKELGTKFQYQTSIETNGKIVNGTLRGNLYIRFDADPSLTTNDLYTLLQQVKSLGVKHISGNVLLSAPLKKTSRAKGWVWDDLGICFAAPISGYILDKNCVTAELLPTKGNKSKVHIFKHVPLQITSTVYFDPKHVQQDCEMALNKVSINHYVIDGCHHNRRKVPLEVAIPDPQQFALDFVAQSLSELGIRVSGRVSNNKINLISNEVHISKVIARHNSEKLPALLKEMLLNSDNMIADTLTKKIGQLEFKTQGSFVNGTRAIKKTMKSLGVDLSDAVLADGSGLSRYNLVSAHQILETLKAIHDTPTLKLLTNALPVAGRSGTLLNKHAFNHPPLKDIITAKTGSMSGVSCLAGYINIKGKHKYAFAILENGISHKQSKKQPFEAAFLKGFIEQIKNGSS
ncbi:D-alanyl-D-alanine carboxypeptidase/D-alanyl-D-alanine-endopeptidase [Shewanella sp. 202IG2-18]|uniref:D-alanyl-D-alanine carboxypeptidase/D-alanyl-D-alanine endopeptidase n=1 Tax=Parashewanella hymeniacidonis TaxID=2807618 RepID=UPI00195F788B|nr:D-alanyl-D-alanine carboxypeptidase/D-alanyl-D-alanine-endopeptidase [Parashewanella hymeniacidonis]MBM7073251.1 D-alanyl-D-alanine carboxypeptidase/D-alanyl-D-alanine-endopeptidase [Parashewanella hymeniacidonis]